MFFSGTLLRFNVRGYVYIWSLIFSMFNFLCVAIYACSLYMLLIVGVLRFMRSHCVCSSCVYLGKLGNGIQGGMGDGGTGV